VEFDHHPVRSIKEASRHFVEVASTLSSERIGAGENAPFHYLGNRATIPSERCASPQTIDFRRDPRRWPADPRKAGRQAAELKWRPPRWSDDRPHQRRPCADKTRMDATLPPVPQPFRPWHPRHGQRHAAVVHLPREEVPPLR